MSAPLELKGTAASPGYAEGPLFDLDRPMARYRPKGNPRLEAEALGQAIAEAGERIAALAAGLEGEPAEMLEFQIAMLSDEELSQPAFEQIESGLAADAAWIEALAAQIEDYASSDEAYFRARSADLTDIRDQVLRALVAAGEELAPAGAILIGDDITPTRFLSTDWSGGGGIALKCGSPASHVAMLARARGVPMVVDLGPFAPNGADLALLDAETGGFVIDPSVEIVEAFRARLAAFEIARAHAGTFLGEPAVTRDGIPVRVLVNVADPADVETIDIGHCDGVGLMRTEFLFGGAYGLPDEETQYRAYRKVLEWAGDKPVTIRTVDAGGDKPVAGYTVAESNPFLGLRGIRLSLERPEIFRVQARALLRAGIHGNLKVMFPMVAIAGEYARARALFEEEAAALAAATVAHRMPPLGIMVEVPSVAVMPEAFGDVAFFSIGSNDLTQYVMAAARDNGAVAALNAVTNPAVLRLIANVCDFADANGIPVSLCGDAGGDPAAIPALLAAGLRDLSVASAQLGSAKAAIAEVVF